MVLQLNIIKVSNVWFLYLIKINFLIFSYLIKIFIILKKKWIKKYSFDYNRIINIFLRPCKNILVEVPQKTTNDLLNSTTVKLNLSEEEKKAALDNVSSLKKHIVFRSNNQELINNLGNLTTLSQGTKIWKSLESLEKDTRIKTLRDAVLERFRNISARNKFERMLKLRMKISKLMLKRELFMFQYLTNYFLQVVVIQFSWTGSSWEIAKVINDKPNGVIESHEYVPINIDGIADNWDLSVKRAVSIVRILQKDFGVPWKDDSCRKKSVYPYLRQ